MKRNSLAEKADKESFKMIPTWLLWITVGWYVILAAFYTFYKAWPLVLYWMGAAMLTLGVIWGTK